MERRLTWFPGGVDPSIAVKFCPLGDLKQRIGGREYIKGKDKRWRWGKQGKKGIRKKMENTKDREEEERKKKEK